MLKLNFEFKPAFRVINSLLSLVFLIFCLELAFDEGKYQLIKTSADSYLSLVNFWGYFLIRFGAYTLMLTALILKIAVFAGIYGTLIEIFSGKEAALRLKDFFNNIKRFWCVYFIVSLIYFFVYKLIVMPLFYFKRLETALGLMLCLELAVNIYLAYFIIRTKCLPSQGKAKLRISFSMPAIVVILSLAVLNIFVRDFLPAKITAVAPAFVQLSALVWGYLQLLLFAYISYQIIKANPSIPQDAKA